MRRRARHVGRVARLGFFGSPARFLGVALSLSDFYFILSVRAEFPLSRGATAFLVDQGTGCAYVSLDTYDFGAFVNTILLHKTKADIAWFAQGFKGPLALDTNRRRLFTWWQYKMLSLWVVDLTTEKAAKTQTDIGAAVCSSLLFRGSNDSLYGLTYEMEPGRHKIVRHAWKLLVICGETCTLLESNDVQPPSFEKNPSRAQLVVDEASDTMYQVWDTCFVNQRDQVVYRLAVEPGDHVSACAAHEGTLYYTTSSVLCAARLADGRKEEPSAKLASASAGFGLIFDLQSCRSGALIALRADSGHAQARLHVYFPNEQRPASFEQAVSMSSD